MGHHLVMAKLVCTQCKAEIEGGEGDASTFVCAKCADKNSLGAFKAELAELEQLGDSKTASQGRRIEFLKAKIASVEA